jgi:REP element-mobilizing transposase RayT
MKENKNISTIVGQYKTAVTKKIRETYPETEVWQRSFHDHIIRDKKDYEKIAKYIRENPINWRLDCFYNDRI